MKTRKTIIILTLTALLAAIPALILAAPGDGYGREPGMRGPGDGGGRGPGHGIERAFEQLDLTETQREQVELVLAENQDSMRAGMERMREARQAMHEQIHAPEFNEDAIRAAAVTLAEIEADVAVSRGRMLQSVREILTPEQQAELEEMIDHRREMAGKRFGRRGGQRRGSPEDF